MVVVVVVVEGGIGRPGGGCTRLRTRAGLVAGPAISRLADSNPVAVDLDFPGRKPTRPLSFPFSLPDRAQRLGSGGRGPGLSGPESRQTRPGRFQRRWSRSRIRAALRSRHSQAAETLWPLKVQACCVYMLGFGTRSCLSRFYRSPEAPLGNPCGLPIDTWSFLPRQSPLSQPHTQPQHSPTPNPRTRSAAPHRRASRQAEPPPPNTTRPQRAAPQSRTDGPAGVRRASRAGPAVCPQGGSRAA